MPRRAGHVSTTFRANVLNACQNWPHLKTSFSRHLVYDRVPRNLLIVRWPRIANAFPPVSPRCPPPRRKPWLAKNRIPVPELVRWSALVAANGKHRLIVLVLREPPIDESEKIPAGYCVVLKGNNSLVMVKSVGKSRICVDVASNLPRSNHHKCLDVRQRRKLRSRIDHLIADWLAKQANRKLVNVFASRESAQNLLGVGRATAKSHHYARVASPISHHGTQSSDTRYAVVRATAIFALSVTSLSAALYSES